jgi:glutathione S-transferase
VSGSGEAEVDFFCSWFCPFAQRAWIALEEKGVRYTYREVNPYEARHGFPRTAPSSMSYWRNPLPSAAVAALFLSMHMRVWTA